MIFSEAFLLKRPLLQAITEHDRAPVLLIDEIDRSDEEFEAFLLEVLSDFQVTIPEIGSIKATHRPHVVLTSNRSRDLSDALRRRCLYHWIDYPSLEKELEIVRARVPGIAETLSSQITQVMQAAPRFIIFVLLCGHGRTLRRHRETRASGKARGHGHARRDARHESKTRRREDVGR